MTDQSLICLSLNLSLSYSSNPFDLYPKTLVTCGLRLFFSENWQPHRDNELVMTTAGLPLSFKDELILVAQD